MAIQIIKDFSLKNKNTFGIDAKASFFCNISKSEELKELFLNEEILNSKRLIIGEGSNLLFTADFSGWVIFPSFKGIEIVSETSEDVYIKAFAGEKWDNFVEYCVENNYFGVENLSLIPGNVGAAPIQNIGAYGFEAKDIIEKVEFFDIFSKEICLLNNSECNFEYRNSIFKNQLKDRIIVISVVFKLSKISKFKIEYKGIQEEMQKFNEISLKNVRKAIINIRNSKLPEVDKIGSAGSFFKNPVISESKFNKIQKKYSDIQFYKQDNSTFKIPAAWLIEKAGFKGYRKNDAGVFQKHALILVNYGNATGKEIFELSNKIQNTILEKFDILIEPEVIIL